MTSAQRAAEMVFYSALMNTTSWPVLDVFVMVEEDPDDYWPASGPDED